VRVDSCTDIVPVLTNELGCTAPSALYDRTEPSPDTTTSDRSAERDLPDLNLFALTGGGESSN
jgi:hypothetical protein